MITPRLLLSLLISILVILISLFFPIAESRTSSNFSDLIALFVIIAIPLITIVLTVGLRKSKKFSFIVSLLTLIGSLVVTPFIYKSEHAAFLLYGLLITLVLGLIVILILIFVFNLLFDYYEKLRNTKPRMANIIIIVLNTLILLSLFFDLFLLYVVPRSL